MADATSPLTPDEVLEVVEWVRVLRKVLRRPCPDCLYRTLCAEDERWNALHGHPYDQGLTLRHCRGWRRPDLVVQAYQEVLDDGTYLYETIYGVEEEPRTYKRPRGRFVLRSKLWLPQRQRVLQKEDPLSHGPLGSRVLAFPRLDVFRDWAVGLAEHGHSLGLDDDAATPVEVYREALARLPDDQAREVYGAPAHPRHAAAVDVLAEDLGVLLGDWPEEATERDFSFDVPPPSAGLGRVLQLAALRRLPVPYPAASSQGSRKADTS